MVHTDLIFLTQHVKQNVLLPSTSWMQLHDRNIRRKHFNSRSVELTSGNIIILL